MIGKMYRPLKILNIPGKRGFSILNKYKSNFSGLFTFDTNIYLNYDAENQTEVVQLEVQGLQIPVYMEQGSPISDERVISSDKERKIESLRKLIRPTKIASKEALDFVMMIESGKDKNETDVLELSFLPIVIDNEEYLKIKIECATPVVVNSNTPIRLGE